MFYMQIKVTQKSLLKKGRLLVVKGEKINPSDERAKNRGPGLKKAWHDHDPPPPCSKAISGEGDVSKLWTGSKTIDQHCNFKNYKMCS